MPKRCMIAFLVVFAVGMILTPIFSGKTIYNLDIVGIILVWVGVVGAYVSATRMMRY